MFSRYLEVFAGCCPELSLVREKKFASGRFLWETVEAERQRRNLWLLSMQYRAERVRKESGVSMEGGINSTPSIPATRAPNERHWRRQTNSQKLE